MAALDLGPNTSLLWFVIIAVANVAIHIYRSSHPKHPAHF